MKPWVFSQLLFLDRSIVRERRPSFEGSFVDTCMLLVGKISGVWGRIGDAFEAAAPDPVAETACMLDMLLLPARTRVPRAQASARVAFRFVCLLREACKTSCHMSVDPCNLALCVGPVLPTARHPWFWGERWLVSRGETCLHPEIVGLGRSAHPICADHLQNQVRRLEKANVAGKPRPSNWMPFSAPPILPLRSLSSELVSLLHDLVEVDTEPPGAGSTGGRKNKAEPELLLSAWREEVATVVRGWLLRAGPVVKSLQRQKVLGEQNLWEEAARARKQSLADDPEGEPATAVRPCRQAKKGTGVNVADGRGVGDGGQREVGFGGDGGLGPVVKGVSSPRGASPLGAISADDLNRVVAVLCLLGGRFEGLHPGARVLCRLPPEESVSDPLDGWEDTPAVEATVLRLGLSGAKLPRIDDVERRAKGMSSSGEPVVDSVSASGRSSRDESSQARQQQQQPPPPLTLPGACPVFSASLVPRRPGCGSRQEVYAGLSDEAYAGSLAAAVVAREVIRDDRARLLQRYQQQQQQLELERERDSQSVLARLEHARLGSVSREHGRSNGFSLLRREPRAPVMREPPGLFLPSGDGGGASASTSRQKHHRHQHHPHHQQRQRPKGQELVSLGVSRKDHGSAPHAVTVPADSVALLRKKVPQALIKTLTSHVEEMLPGLKAMLEAETVFRGEQSKRTR